MLQEFDVYRCVRSSKIIMPKTFRQRWQHSTWMHLWPNKTDEVLAEVVIVRGLHQETLHLIDVCRLECPFLACLHRMRKWFFWVWRSQMKPADSEFHGNWRLVQIAVKLLEMEDFSRQEVHFGGGSLSLLSIVHQKSVYIVWQLWSISFSFPSTVDCHGLTSLTGNLRVVAFHSTAALER